MRTFAVLLLAVLGVSSGLHFDADDAKNRPVSKVVTLLKDMSSQLEKEAEEDEEVYDKMVCWCETNDKDKTQAIALAESRLRTLGAQIPELAGKSARLAAEISTLEKEVATNTDALDKASALREKELAEFTQQESDQLASIQSLKSAVNTLAKHNSLAQQSDEEQASLRSVLKHSMRYNDKLMEQIMLPSERRVLSGFLQGPQNAGSYAPQSGAIFGILKNMKESFEANLAAAQREEQESSKAFEELKAAKESEIAAGTKQIEKKTNQMAEADEKRAVSKEDEEDTSTTLKADQEFLANLKTHCALMDKEMERRSKTRQEEIGAVSKAMAVLTNDDAHDLFTKTLGFIQKSQTSSSLVDRRREAARVLAMAAKAAKNPRLAALATRARLDAFGKVKQNIDKMVGDLTKEKEDEIALKDWCISEIQKNERTTEMTDRNKERLFEKVNDLKMTIDTLTSEIVALNGEIASMHTEMKRAGEDRELENKNFQQTIADQQATAALLTKALNVLKGFYDKKAAFVQRSTKQEPAGAPPPPGFKTYQKNAQSGGVMGMIQQIINDAKAMEKEAVQDELQAQTAYESFVTDTNAAIEAAQKSIMNKSDAKAKAEGEKTETSVELDHTMDTLEQLASENMDLHGECDYTIKNFDTKQESRDNEIEALKQSSAILSGANFGTFLEVTPADK